MRDNKAFSMEIIQETMKNLEANNMKPYFVKTKEEARTLVESLLTSGETIASGGSQTLKACAVDTLIKNGDYNYLDRETAENVEDVYLGAFTSDTYLMSTNALTRSGVLYNVDGNSNRVAALLYGPKSVIVLCGYNKIVDTIQDAVERVKHIAAPLNTVRLHTGSYCENAGVCKGAGSEEICDGCKGAGRICCNFVLTAQQRKKDRIKVIIVGEELGY